MTIVSLVKYYDHKGLENMANTDYSRFFNDPKFPYKVTACFGTKRIFCSGILLCQQSEVIERKIREDGGVLMLDEFLDVENSERVLVECLMFLHGAPLVFSSANIDVIFKFASWYKIKELTEKALQWLKDKHEEYEVLIDITEVVHWLKLSNCLDTEELDRLKQTVRTIICQSTNVIDSGIEVDSGIESLTGDDWVMMLKICPKQSKRCFKKWISLSSCNKTFVLENHVSFRFNSIFLDEKEFSGFINTLSGADVLSAENCTILQKLRNYIDYFNPGDKDFMKTIMLHEAAQMAAEEPGKYQETDPLHDDLPVSSEHLDWTLKVLESLPGPSNWQKEDGPGPSSSEQANMPDTIFVGNLPQFAEKGEITHLFASPIGQIRDVSLRRGRGRGRSNYAIVNYTDPRAARAVVTCYRQHPAQYTIGNRQLHVKLKMT